GVRSLLRVRDDRDQLPVVAPGLLQVVPDVRARLKRRARVLAHRHAPAPRPVDERHAPVLHGADLILVVLRNQSPPPRHLNSAAFIAYSVATRERPRGLRRRAATL